MIEVVFYEAEIRGYNIFGVRKAKWYEEEQFIPKRYVIADITDDELVELLMLRANNTKEFIEQIKLELSISLTHYNN